MATGIFCAASVKKTTARMPEMDRALEYAGQEVLSPIPLIKRQAKESTASGK